MAAATLGTEADSDHLRSERTDLSCAAQRRSSHGTQDLHTVQGSKHRQYEKATKKVTGIKPQLLACFSLVSENACALFPTITLDLRVSNGRDKTQQNSLLQSTFPFLFPAVMHTNIHGTLKNWCCKISQRLVCEQCKFRTCYCSKLYP